MHFSLHNYYYVIMLRIFHLDKFQYILPGIKIIQFLFDLLLFSLCSFSSTAIMLKTRFSDWLC